MTPRWCRATGYLLAGAVLLLDHATPAESLVGLLLVCAGVGLLETSAEPTHAPDESCHRRDASSWSAVRNAEDRAP